ncbi:hypothetical protein NKH14_06935 [Mesorhizobium sp. M1380]|uniref:hypothetical protein n=1 Tax=Mesorhizobium sp. M1380 TaxID=2957093 RepID=UPI00333BCDBC
MADETTPEPVAEIAPEAPSEPVTKTKGKAKEAKLPTNHELLLSGNVLVSH